MRIFLSNLIDRKPPWTIVAQDSKGQLFKNSPSLWLKGVWDPRLSFCVLFLTPIAMTIRVCPGAFGLELGRPNRNQATTEIYPKCWFYTGFISMSNWHQSTFLHWCWHWRAFSLHRRKARAILAFQHCIRFLNVMTALISKPIKHTQVL